MRIEQIRITAAMLVILFLGLGVDRAQLIAQEFSGAVTLAQAGPQVHFPAQGPAGAIIATADQRLPAGCCQLWSLFHAVQTARVEAQQMGGVAVFNLDLLHPLVPFGQSAIQWIRRVVDHHRTTQPGQGSPQLLAQWILAIGAFLTGCFDRIDRCQNMREQELHQLLAQGSPATDAGALSLRGHEFVLRRGHRGKDQLAFRIFHQHFGQEAGTFCHQGQNPFAEQNRVRSILGLLIQCLAQPGRAQRPVAPDHAVLAQAADRVTVAPDIGIVMDHHARRIIIGPGSLFGFGPAGLQQREQRRQAVAQAEQAGAPVIHFRIDIDGIVAAPGRLEMLIPDALQIHRLCPGAGGGDHQVAAIVEKQGIQGLIVTIGIPGQAVEAPQRVELAELFGPRHFDLAVQVDLDTLVQRSMVRLVAGQKCLIAISLRLCQVLLCQSQLIQTIQIGMAGRTIK